MRKRLVQVFGFLASSLGWLFVLVTMAMDFWRISQIGGQGGSWIIKVAWYWSNLWKDCYTDSTAVTNCRDYPVLWSVAGECCRADDASLTAVFIVGRQMPSINGDRQTCDRKV